jgi:hypothetical protein
MDYFENQQKQFFDYVDELKNNEDVDYCMVFAY